MNSSLDLDVNFEVCERSGVLEGVLELFQISGALSEGMEIEGDCCSAVFSDVLVGIHSG